MPAAHELDFLVQRNNLHKYAIERAAATAEMGQMLISVEKFAFTSNNITYPLFGDPVP